MSTRPLPKSLQDYLGIHPDKFDEGWLEQDGWNSERPNAWNYWVYLKPGWANTVMEPWGGMHIIHESSIKEVKYQFSRASRCQCKGCVKILTKKKVA